jgi:hypothetical protein
MMPAKSKASSGLSISFPDVCKTPAIPIPVPIPYPNIAKSASEAQKKKTKVGTKNVMMKGSAFSKSRGDAPGTMKGMVSASVQGEVNQLKGMLNQLNSKLQGLKSNDPDEWQVVVQEYVVAASALYVTINDSE